ncbi:MAG: GNAT family N-acetyltransferase [Aigarchaeota archaeon]|nr:GNAT family N-acetyltransferase [Aigarchaeota archaeon]MDW8092239.1 GNAT family N-acetyltransferase [Nitrososphaerota archaeon]
MKELLEENENGFFSLWSDKETYRRAILLCNPVFHDDPLFNHATGTLDSEDVIEFIIRYFDSRNVRPAIYANPWNLFPLREVLLGYGFRLWDELFVEVRGADPQSPTQSTLRPVEDTDALRTWIEIYESAFKIPSYWHREIEVRTKTMLRRDDVTLFVKYAGEIPVGSLAAYFTGDLCGLYCIGTPPKYRGKGIGSSMINEAVRVAGMRGARAVCLQTLASDKLTGFYERLGFRVAYKKQVYLR